MNFDIRYYGSLSSTIDEAINLYEAKQADVGSVIIASEQTQGRGRFQRPWISKQGNLLATLIWCAPTSVLFAYPFLTALAITNTFAKLGICNLLLKWPNDILVEGKKLGGILLEVIETQKDSVIFTISFGINLLHAPELTSYPTTSILDATAIKIEPNDILPSVLEQFIYLHSIFETQGFKILRQGFLELNHFKDKAMTIKVGQKTITGEFHDLGLQGELILRLSDGSFQTFTSGDVGLV